MLRSKSLVLCLAMVLPTMISAHGTMTVPKVVFKDPDNKDAPSVSINGGQAGPYTGNDVLRDLADKHGSKCGNTDANAPVQPIPADGMVSFEITAMHIGPCELWLDNEKVVSAKECKEVFPKTKVDFSKCKSGKCQLRWVWLATHNSPWEIFDNCANVGGGGGSGDSTTKPSTAPSPSPSSSPSSSPSMNPSPAPRPEPVGPVAPKTTAPAPAPGPKPGPVAPETPKPSSSNKPDGKPTLSPDTPGTVRPADPDAGKKYRAKRGATSEWCEANCKDQFCPEDFCEPM
ncbi:TPA: hypothetical protein N0F65_002224 [Lagenidium giganteum]|uniref:Chitin-binding type-4 domain-containing protein n=1 Tax=Lagenidium giganteum TaxID=4803 RepID=A0AAV2YU25_9STRA|nr:TPA: hypothetical protein N0F65_002224 [Lagenidium giganteum]